MDISQSVTSPLHNSSATVSPHPTPALPPPISHLPAPRCPENHILRRCLTTLTLPMPLRPDTHPPQSLLPRASQHSPPPCCRVTTPTRVAKSCHNITFFTSTRARYLPPFADSILTSSPAPAPDTHLLWSAQDTYLLPCILPHSSASASPLVL